MRHHPLAVIGFLAFFCTLSVSSLAYPSGDSSSVAVCFTPGNDCDDMLIAAINGAQKTVRMAAYSFTSAPIADALIAARQRGVKVWVVLDSGQWSARGSQGHRLRQAGVGVRYDAKHAIMHNKFVVVDVATVATGSYNYTDAAQNRNAENMLFVIDRPMAREYANEWGWHWSHSEKNVR